jgi:hypothetical protein
MWENSDCIKLSKLKQQKTTKKMPIHFFQVLQYELILNPSKDTIRNRQNNADPASHTECSHGFFRTGEQLNIVLEAGGFRNKTTPYCQKYFYFSFNSPSPPI